MARYLHDPSKSDAERLIAAEVLLCPLATTHPALWEYLTETRWESGESRTTSTLMLFVEEGLVKLCLHDRSMRRTLWKAASSWSEALARLEGDLARGDGEWRKDKVFKGRG